MATIKRPANYEVPLSTFTKILKDFPKIKDNDFEGNETSFNKFRDYGFCFKFDEKNTEKLNVFGVFLNNKKLIEESNNSKQVLTYEISTPLMILSNGKIATTGMLSSLVNRKIAGSKFIAELQQIQIKCSSIEDVAAYEADGRIDLGLSAQPKANKTSMIINDAGKISDKLSGDTLQDFDFVFFPATVIFYLLTLSNAPEKTLLFKRGVSQFADWGTYCTFFAIPLFSAQDRMVPKSYGSTPPPAGTNGITLPPPTT